MCRTVHWLAVISLCLFPLALRAQDRPASSGTGTLKREAPADGASAAVIAIDLVIADVGPVDKAEAAPDDKDVPARVRDLEKQGKLARMTRMRLTTISEQVAMAQFGERVPLATGRTFGGRGGAAAAALVGGGGGALEGPTSYTYQNIGTLINVVPKVEGDRVIMECSVECTRLAPRKPATDKPEGSFEPTALETIQAKSAVTVKSGETVLLTGKQSSGADGITRTYVLVTATIQDPGRKDAASIKIMTLVHAKAIGVAETLRDILGKTSLRISVDERTNSVVARGSAEDLEICEGIALRLDEK